MLDHRARGQARATAEQLLALRATDVAVLQSDGSIRRRAQQPVAEGDRVLVGDAASESASTAWWSAGASCWTPAWSPARACRSAATPGAAVFAGTLNLGAALTVRATATGGATLLAECVRLIEAAEATRGRASSCSPTGWRDATRRRCTSLRC